MEIVAVYSENHKEPINKKFRAIAIIKATGTNGYLLAIKGV
jgi:hypothetical protein